MTTDRPIDYPPASPSQAMSEAASTQSTDWLSSVRARLGISGPRSLRDTIELSLGEGPAADTAFSTEERAMLRRLLRFGKCRVEDVMVPRADVIAVDDTESIQDLLATFEEAGVSRVPIFTGTLDDPLGMIHIKDLFRWLLADAVGKTSSNKNAENVSATNNGSRKGGKRHSGNGVRNVKKNAASSPKLTSENQASESDAPGLSLGSVDLSRPVSIAKIKRPVLFVPPSMPAMNLLIRMQSTRNHMALVIDEYGGTDGLVTIEDLVEQIVGEIEDEHDDAEEVHIVHDAKLGLIASARTPLEELADHLDCKLLTSEQEEEIDTLGGLVFALVGRVPSRGEIIRHPTGIEFEVLDADPRRVKTLKIHVPEDVDCESVRSRAGGGAGARDGTSRSD